MRKYTPRILIIIMLIVVITLSTASVLALPVVNDSEVLSKIGIIVKSGECQGDYKETVIALPGISLVKNGEYLSIKLEEKTDRIYYLHEAGKPRLPYKYVILTFNGKVKVKGVEAVNVKFIERKVQAYIEPASKPIPYIIGYNATKDKMTQLDKSVYNRSMYYPGKLFSYYVGYGLDKKTYVIVWIYPVQYNPVKKSLIEVLELTLKVYFEKVGTHTLEASNVDEGNVLILTVKELADVAMDYKNTISKLTGFNVTIVTTDWIYEHIAPAENITMYPGFYTYRPMFKISGMKDPYEDLVKLYNWTLALKIIKYLRNETLHPNLKYIMILGSARKVPPSFYYLSFENFRYMPYQGWVPTDFFYASPDYDLVPNYYVGRIPFDDPTILSSFLNKLVNWYNITLENPLWVKKVALFGGFPFLRSFLFGESALGRVVNEGFLASFNVTLHTRTDKTYTRLSAAKVFEGGEYAWAFYLLHGSGNAMIDYNIINGRFTIEFIMDSNRLLQLKPNPMLPIITSVACTNAAWDTELLNPTEYKMFMPPSFGQAVLMSPAGGIAYIGFSRIAWEAGIKFILDRGVFKPEFYGAAWLLSLIYKAYTDLSGIKNFTTLGEVVSYALVDYLATAGSALMGWEQSVMMLTVMELSLLGDPSLKMPLFKPPEKIENIEGAVFRKYRQLVSALIIYAYSDRVKGEIPYYKAPVDTVLVDIKSPAEKVKAYIIKIAQTRFSGYLSGLKVVNIEELKVINGTATLSVKTSKSVSSYIVIRLKTRMGDLRLYMISYGLIAKPSEVGVGEPVFIEGFGLNVVFDPWTPIALEYAGRFLTLIFMNEEGYFNKTVALPQIAPGKYSLVAYAFGTYGWMPSGITLPPPPMVEIVTKGIGVLDINLAYSFEYRPGEKANITIATLYQGRPVDSEVKVKLVTPSGKEIPLSIVKCDVGKYMTSFVVPKEVGSYILYVEAKVVSEYLSVYGSKVASFTVREDVTSAIVKSVGEKLSETEKNIKSYIEGEIVKLSGDLEEGFAVIKTEYGEVKKKLSDIVESIEIVNDTIVKIHTKLGVITGEISEVKGDIVKIKTELGTISVNISGLSEAISTGTSKLLSEIGKVSSKVSDNSKTLGKLSEDLKRMGETLDLMSKVVLGVMGLAAVTVAGLGALMLRGRKG